jgi:glycosyltransferase involved in cell wall biosynthesis
MHRISVIIPGYNTGVYLGECVSSIRENSVGVELEVIIVDDGSIDETTIRLLDQFDTEPDLRVIRHGQNRGVQAARNTGLKAATGDFVVCVDADDVLLPTSEHGGYLSAGAHMLSESPSVAFVHTLSNMFGDFNGLTISSYPLNEEMVARKHHVPTHIMYRRSELSNGLHYLETVTKWQDWAFGVSLLARRWARDESLDIGFIKGPGYGYRIHSTTARVSRAQVSEYDATKLVVESYQDYFRSRFPNVENTIDALTAAVMASKPTALEDLLYVASFDLEQALSMAQGREYQVHSAHVDRLGIP